MTAPPPVLFAQATIHEIAALWHKHPNTVRYHLDRGSLKGRKARSIWLIQVGSAIALWGDPVNGCTELLCA